MTMLPDLCNRVRASRVTLDDSRVVVLAVFFRDTCPLQPMQTFEGEATLSLANALQGWERRIPYSNDPQLSFIREYVKPELSA